MNSELAQLAGGLGPRNRWYGCGVSVCLARFESRTASKKHPLDWDKVLGLATVLAVLALGWTAVGFTVSHLVR
jgi:hypothetical protein